MKDFVVYLAGFTFVSEHATRAEAKQAARAAMPLSPNGVTLVWSRGAAMIMDRCKLGEEERRWPW